MLALVYLVVAMTVHFAVDAVASPCKVEIASTTPRAVRDSAHHEEEIQRHPAPDVELHELRARQQEAGLLAQAGPGLLALASEFEAIPAPQF